MPNPITISLEHRCDVWRLDAVADRPDGLRLRDPGVLPVRQHREASEGDEQMKLENLNHRSATLAFSTFLRLQAGPLHLIIAPCLRGEKWDVPKSCEVASRDGKIMGISDGFNMFTMRELQNIARWGIFAVTENDGKIGEYACKDHNHHHNPGLDELDDRQTHWFGNFLGDILFDNRKVPGKVWFKDSADDKAKMN